MMFKKLILFHLNNEILFLQNFHQKREKANLLGIRGMQESVREIEVKPHKYVKKILIFIVLSCNVLLKTKQQNTYGVVHK